MKIQILFATLFLTISFNSRGIELPLFKKLPGLANIPRVEILSQYTDVMPLKNIENELNQKLYQQKTQYLSNRLWIKRDDRSSAVLGGNKARKLEFILGQMKLDGAKKIITAGMWGSNHALATSLACKQHGLTPILHLGPQPVTENVKKKLLSFYALGAKMVYHKNQISMGMGIVESYFKSLLRKDTFYIPPGGSSPTGTLGYVNAFLELVEQVGVENLPDRIYVPMGTAGTSAGLLLGSCLAGTLDKTTIVAVGIADSVLSNESTIWRLARKTYHMISHHLSKEERKQLPHCSFTQHRQGLNYRSEYSKPGYGAATPEVFEAIKMMKDKEGITLEQTYSGKAFRALLDDTQADFEKGLPAKKSLFWLTYNSHPLDEIIASFAWKDPLHPWLDLPKKFHHLFESNDFNSTEQEQSH